MTPTLVILAAGMSSRYGRLKQLEPLGPSGEALLDYSVFDAWRAGFRRVVLVIRPELEEAFRSHIGSRWPGDLDVVFHHQRLGDVHLGDTHRGDAAWLASVRRSKPWGTAHALLSARELLQEGPFALINADDFYGESAYREAAAFIEATWSRERAPATEGAGGGLLTKFGLMTYGLEATLSPHGGVNRGVCAVDGSGRLAGVEEVMDICRGAEGLAGRSLAGEPIRLNGDEPVSMNFWVFGPAVFPFLAEGFHEFLEDVRAAVQRDEGGNGESHTGPVPEPEFLVPTEVNRMVSHGDASVFTVPVQGSFLGITHPEDREWVVGGLALLAEEGRYPQRLWS